MALRLAAAGMAFLSPSHTGHPPEPGSTVLSKELVPAAYGVDSATGAACLDGTLPGFWIWKTPNVTHANDWMLYFQGGGWCYSEADCWGRSLTTLGSSKAWPPTQMLGGMLGGDCTKNPDFCHFNKVMIGYCDGNSFASNRHDAVPVVAPGAAPNTKIFFRGKRNIDAVLRTLVDRHGLADATTVLQTGGSAGGLATFLHADYVHQQMSMIASNLVKYRAAPISGFFLDHPNVAGDPVYGTMIQNLFAISNATGGVNSGCIAASNISEWRCNFAAGSYSATKTPIFVLNSVLDSWQTGCIYTASLDPGFPGSHHTSLEHAHCADVGHAAGAKTGPWTKCSGNPEDCNSTQMVTMNTYIKDFISTIKAAPTFSAAGNGAFLVSCHTHCEAQSSAWNKFAIGGVTIQQAMSAWWRSDGTEPASIHTHLPCEYHTEAGVPHKCNPTC